MGLAAARLLPTLLVVGACAAPMPAWEGGSTTPHRRTDLALGGAARVPVANMRRRAPTQSAYRDVAENGGVVPVGATRVGLDHGYDLGLMVAGSVVRADLRREIVTSNGSTRKAFVFALSPFGGAITDPDDRGSGVRFGGEIRAAYGADIGGLYDVWLGVRLGAEHIRGEFDLGAVRESAKGTALRAGAMIGLAVGFRRFHAFVEVTAWAEGWLAEHRDIDLDRFGLVLTPTFGVRLRL
jgi:hypothetical protein